MKLHQMRECFRGIARRIVEHLLEQIALHLSNLFALQP